MRERQLLKADPERQRAATASQCEAKVITTNCRLAPNGGAGGVAVESARRQVASGMWQAALLPLSEPDRPGKRIVIANGRARKHNNTTPARAPAPVPAASPTPAALLLPVQLPSCSLSLNQTQYGCPRWSIRNGQTRKHGQKGEQGKSRRGEQEQEKEREKHGATWKEQLEKVKVKCRAGQTKRPRLA